MITPMRLATWNVNSVRARLPRLLPWLESTRPDVVCLQELKCQDHEFPAEPIAALGYEFATFGQKTYNGVAILSRTPLSDVRRGMEGDPAEGERRVIAARVGGLTVVNAYCVNGQEVGSEKYKFKLEWFERLRAHVGAFDLSGPLALVGDFNVTFDDRDVYDPKEWHEAILCSTPEREALGKLCQLGLADAFRRFHEEGGHYTWWDFRTRGFQRKQGLRIDHLLLTKSALDRCSDVSIDLVARDGEKPSDHAPVVATLDF
jgi:exodeoxyribonuclease III